MTYINLNRKINLPKLGDVLKQILSSIQEFSDRSLIRYWENYEGTLNFKEQSWKAQNQKQTQASNVQIIAQANPLKRKIEDALDDQNPDLATKYIDELRSLTSTSLVDETRDKYFTFCKKMEEKLHVFSRNFMVIKEEPESINEQQDRLSHSQQIQQEQEANLQTEEEEEAKRQAEEEAKRQAEEEEAKRQVEEEEAKRQVEEEEAKRQAEEEEEAKRQVEEEEAKRQAEEEEASVKPKKKKKPSVKPKKKKKPSVKPKKKKPSVKPKKKKLNDKRN